MYSILILKFFFFIFINFNSIIEKPLLKMDNQLIYFILSTLLFGFLIIYFIFYSSFILGFIVSKALSFAVGKSTYISIGSMNYSLLTGHILFRNVVYATKDASIRIVDGALTFRWWRTNIRRTLQNAEPCRLEFNLTGVEFLLYNNSSRYEFLQSLLQRRNSNGNVTLGKINFHFIKL